jgi:hypothetical protein
MGYVAIVRRMRNSYILVENLTGIGHMGDLDISERIILKFMFKHDVRMWIGLIWLMITSNSGCLCKR